MLLQRVAGKRQRDATRIALEVLSAEVAIEIGDALDGRANCRVGQCQPGQCQVGQLSTARPMLAVLIAKLNRDSERRSRRCRFMARSVTAREPGSGAVPQ